MVRAKNYTVFKTKAKLGLINVNTGVKDVLFVCGCDLPHPQRYRIDHQIEQLESCGMTTDRIPHNALWDDAAKYYRAIVIFRCPLTKKVEKLIEQAHYYNKRVFFDIDDLIIDTKYTDAIEYIQQMKAEDRERYDADVRKMGETMKLCDYCITTTGALARELKKYKKEVFVNRNVASEEMVKLSQEAMQKTKKDGDKIMIGYLSGSITHNPDFEMIKPALMKVMNENPKVELVLMGLLDLPEDMQKFNKRIKQLPFSDWRKLPSVIAGLDINLAPIEESTFNETKSENKWMEAALCKVVTVASNFGAFKEIVINGKTGFLCKNEDEWYMTIKKLANDKLLREKVGERAYQKVIKEYVTIYTGTGLRNFIESKLARNIAIIMPSTDVVSGGVNVALKHCNILRENGWDVTAIDMHTNDKDVIFDNESVNVINGTKHEIMARFDEMVATLYTTLDFVIKYPKVKQRKYLVQGFETDFYEFGDSLKKVANATYNYEGIVQYITISKWCQDWLKKIFGQKVKYAPNGIETSNFKWRKRDFKGKIKILIEGNSDNEYKNVDESFEIVNKLDRSKYEIVYLSYGGGPKDWYRVDKFYNKVPFEEVGEVYRECDILLKTSKVESFSYPPLEMMATGGYVVARPNEGNIEFLQNDKNCLMYEPENIEQGVKMIDRIVESKTLRAKLDVGAKKTIEERDWKNIKYKVLDLYK